VTHCKIDAAGGTLQNYKSINNVQLANDSWNKYVLVIRRNVSKESEFRISGGRLFQARAAATENARSPSVDDAELTAVATSDCRQNADDN